MYDDRPLVDLLNARFDDMSQKISELRADLIRQVQKQEEKFDEHEEKDQERFDHINKFKWQLSGAGVTLIALVKVLERYFDR